MNHWASSAVYGRLIDRGDDGECVCVEDFMTDNNGKKLSFL